MTAEIPEGLKTELVEALENSEAYETICGLPEDDALIEMLRQYSQETKTLGKGYAVTGYLAGIPKRIYQDWPKKDRLVRGASEDPLTGKLDAAGSIMPDILPAYGLDFEVGTYDAHGEEQSFLLHLSEAVTGNSVTIRRAGSLKQPTPYDLCDAMGVKLAGLEAEQVAQLLASIAGLTPRLNDITGEPAQISALINYLGQKFGTSRNDYKITTRMIDNNQVAEGESYGAIVFREEETLADSSKSFVVERFTRYKALDSDEVLRLKATYSNLPKVSPQPELAETAVQLGKTITSPAKYDIKDIAIEQGIAGTTRALELTIDKLDIIIGTLQEVIASQSENLLK